MKKGHRRLILIVVWLAPLFVAGEGVAQIDTTLRSFFPMQIGDYWEYMDDGFPTSEFHYYVKVKRDTLMANGKWYRVFNDVDFGHPADSNRYNYLYRIDDSMRVWTYTGDSSLCPAREYVVYQLTAANRGFWPVCVDFVPTSPQEYIGLYSTQEDYFPHLALDTLSKYFIGPVYMENGDTIWGGAYFFRNWLARGLGVARTQGEAGPPIYLIGAIIDRRRYGYITHLSEQRAMPSRLNLAQNYPNPFNPRTSIHYDVPSRSHVRLIVSDLLGRVVAVLVDRIVEPGRHTAEFNAEHIASGVYYYQLRAGDFVQTKKLILLR